MCPSHCAAPDIKYLPLYHKHLPILVFRSPLTTFFFPAFCANSPWWNPLLMIMEDLASPTTYNTKKSTKFSTSGWSIEYAYRRNCNYIWTRKSSSLDKAPRNMKARHLLQDQRCNEHRLDRRGSPEHEKSACYQKVRNDWYTLYVWQLPDTIGARMLRKERIKMEWKRIFTSQISSW